MGKGKGSLLKCSVKNGIYFKGKGLDLKAEPPRINFVNYLPGYALAIFNLPNKLNLAGFHSR